MLDLNLFREEKGGDPESIRESQRRRGHDVGLVDKVIELDKECRIYRFDFEHLQRIMSLCSKAIGARKKAKEADGDVEEISDEVKELVATKKFGADDAVPLCVKQLKTAKSYAESCSEEVRGKLARLEAERDQVVLLIGNLVHDSVPVSNTEDDNRVERLGGETQERKKYSHVDLIVMIDGVDCERGTVTAGNRGYYLKGAGVFLEMALFQFGLHFMVERNAGWTPLYTPFFMRKDIMAEVAQLSQFDDELYKVTGKRSEDPTDTNEDVKYLIATSEQPIAAYHRDEWIDRKALPIRYVGVSTCFRQEVGSHGRDTGGIFRVHQFEKLEQFVLTSPHGDAVDEAGAGASSWECFDEMIGNAEAFYDALGIGYRIVNIVSGAINLAASKKFDLEAWFPGSGAFRELVSCSNCLSYQSRRLKVRYGVSKQSDKPAEYVHMLNGTLAAMTRVICCILETHQCDEGIRVPEPLQKYMPAQWRTLIPFVKPAPIDLINEKKAKGKGKASNKKE